MKTTITHVFAGAAIIAVSALAACSSGSKNASDKADSVNKGLTEKADSTNKAAVAAADSVNSLREDAAQFLVKSYESGIFEIQLSQLAATNATSTQVKTFAAHLVTAHTDINSQMLKIAMNANYKLPGAVDAGHAKTLDEMTRTKGNDFDKKYMDMMVSGHEKSVKNYSDAAHNLSGGATKEFATATLPKIEDHLAMAKKVKDGLK